MDKKKEVLDYLHENVFDPILNSSKASRGLKQGVQLTIMRMNERDHAGIVHYYLSAISGTDRSIKFADDMKAEGFTRFEEIFEDFRIRFDDKWLKS